MKFLRTRARGRRAATTLFALAFLAAGAGAALAHPLGNFTINSFSRIEPGEREIAVRYVVDMAEISAFQEGQLADANKDGATSPDELEAHVARAVEGYAANLIVRVDGAAVTLAPVRHAVSTPPGAGGLNTLRVELDLVGAIPEPSTRARAVEFENRNFAERIGWNEIVLAPARGAVAYDSTAFANAITDELKAYPEDSIAAPLDERSARFAFTSGAVPPDAALLATRDGKLVTASRDVFAELISVKDLTPGAAALGLLIAFALGGLHAMSPGHGKTVVGAYLVGSRGTIKHAAFLGLTVTVTHTAGVFALGFVTLFASQYVVPEKIFPVLGVVSGLLVAGIGAAMFFKRSRKIVEAGHSHSHDHDHDGHHHTHGGGHSHDHAHDHAGAHMHSHGGGKPHSHLPPGAAGEKITWASLLALGVSGGLLPCPSALVVLLAAVNLHRVGYGMFLIVAFSLGLATVLTAVGLVFLYAKNLMTPSMRSSRLARALPALSALVVTCVGLVLTFQALTQAGVDVAGPFSTLLKFGGL